MSINVNLGKDIYTYTVRMIANDKSIIYNDGVYVYN